MNEKEIAEIRRRFRPEKSNITRIRGCYVNEQGEIISEFSQSLALLPQEESEELLALLKKTLSGAIGKSLIDIEFETQQVLEGDEHKLLMALRESALENDDAVRAFYERVIGSLRVEGNYLILLACDKYDVPCYAKDGEKQVDASTEMFSYFLCSVCPVKLTKPALGFHAAENTFRNITAGWAVSAPELGFLFPAFDNRSANIYNALYYSRNPAENHAEFVDAVFKREIPMPAAAQKETFQSILSAVAEDCSFEVVQTVHEQLSGMIEEHKSKKEEAPPVISKHTVKDILSSCGVSEEHVAAFEEEYDSGFGAEAEISPQTVIDAKQLELRTADVTIHVNPERSDLVETRIINGSRYILIRADDDVVVNGVKIHIS